MFSACEPDAAFFRDRYRGRCVGVQACAGLLSAGLTKLNEKRQHERKLPLLASECLAIEDSPPGIESARAAGMRTLGVTNTVPARRCGLPARKS